MNVIPEVVHGLKVGRRKVSDGAGDWSNEPQTAVLFSRCAPADFYILLQATNQM